MKFLKKFLAISLILSMVQTTAVMAAPRYTDVAESHWAYSSIVAMADKGYIVGNISGEYKPDNPIDKFETSKILAMAAGYKYSGATEAESTAYLAAYNTYKAFLESYDANYTKWSPNTDREIAYLLNKGIYDTADLDLFIVKSGDKENLRALSRQEAAVYLVKLMGRKDAALSYSYSSTFSDDDKISAEYKPYVYYLKSLGVLSGQSDNSFNPNGAVTRAAMAVMLDKALKLGVNTSTNTPAGTTPGTVTGDGGSASALIDTISGKVEKVHTSLTAVQIQYDTGETKIHKVEPSANIFIDGYIKSMYDLEEGMPVIGIVKNNAVIDLKAQSVKDAPSQGSGTSTDSSSQSPAQVPQTTVPDNVEYRSLQGTVKDVKSVGSDRTITIEVRIINPSGGIITEQETFRVEDDCLITRGGKDVTFSSAAINDVVKAKVYSGKAYVLELEEKDRRMNVVVTDRKTETALGTNFFVVEDSAGKTHELVVTGDTVLTRKGMGTVNFSDVRIGDNLDLLAEYSVIKEAYAYGEQGYTEGTVSEIHITRDGTSIMLVDSSGKAVKYHVINGAFDIYNLRLNSRVRLRLDSKEIEGISVLQEELADYFTGTIDSINSRYIALKSSVSSNTVKVYYDSNTTVTDSITGQKSSLNALYAGMKVYIMFIDSSSDTAKSITILEK